MAMLKEHEASSCEAEHRTRNDGLFPVDLALSYLHYERKEYNCIFARDIPERKRAEDSLHQAKDEMSWKCASRDSDYCLDSECTPRGPGALFRSRHG